MPEDLDGEKLRRALKTAFWRAGGLSVLAKSVEGRRNVLNICVEEMLGVLARPDRPDAPDKAPT